MCGFIRKKNIWFNAFIAIDSNGDKNAHVLVETTCFVFSMRHSHLTPEAIHWWMCAFSAVAVAVCVHRFVYGNAYSWNLPQCIASYRSNIQKPSHTQTDTFFLSLHFLRLKHANGERMTGIELRKKNHTKRMNTNKYLSGFFFIALTYTIHTFSRASFFDHRYTGSEATKQ